MNETKYERTAEFYEVHFVSREWGVGEGAYAARKEVVRFRNRKSAEFYASQIATCEDTEGAIVTSGLTGEVLSEYSSAHLCECD